MNFDLTEEQMMLVDSVSRWLEKSYPFDVRLTRARNENGFSAEAWQQFAELGWLGTGIPETYGGYGFGVIERALIAEQLGRALVLEPYVLCAVLPSSLILQCATEAQKIELLAALMSGEQLFAAALSEPHSRGDMSRIGLTARRTDSGYVLDGAKSLVVGLPVADRLLVSACVDGGDGVSLFLLDPSAAGVTQKSYALMDGTPAADVFLDQLQVPLEALLGDEGAALPGIQRAVDETILVQCAEMLGDMEDAIALTAEYVKVRKQFGVEIGSFQAVQHRLADMAIEMSQARSSVQLGFLALTADAPETDSSVEVSGCKAQLMRSAHFVTSQGIQLHGGYGITEEYKVGHHFRRLLIVDPMFGNSHYHENRYARRLQAQALAAAD